MLAFPNAMMCGKITVKLEIFIYTLAKIALENACKLGYKVEIFQRGINFFFVDVKAYYIGG